MVLQVQHQRKTFGIPGQDSPKAATGYGHHSWFQSFGFKHGAPRDADLVLDCRFLPNPHWVEKLRPLSGLDRPVREHVLGQDLTMAFLEQLHGMLDLLLPAYATEGRSYLSVAFGCTGGRHRSVAVSESVVGHLRAQGYDPLIGHRDIDR